MDAMPAFGSLIITEGATAPSVVVAPTEVSAAQPALATPSPEQLQAVDQVFTNPTSSEQNPAVPFFVITACASALKGVVIDESERWNKEEKEEAEEDAKISDASKKRKERAPS